MRVMYLIGFTAVAIAIWMLPVVLMGFPVHMPGLDAVRLYMETGAIPYGNGHFSAILFGFFSPWIAWENLIGWTLLSAVALGLALLSFWWSVRRVFNEQTAWVAVSVFAAMPVYFQEAIHLNDYTFAYLALFESIATFLYFKNPILKLSLSGALFGLCLGFKEAFIVLLPWCIGSYMWSHGKEWRKALLHVFVFLACAGFIYTLPVLPRVLTNGDLVQLLPVGGTKPFGEFYPDEYTYDFEREWYEAKVIEERSRSDISFLERAKGDNRLILFGIGDLGPVFSLFNGFWLFINRIPGFFATDTVGGAVLWLFFLPGGITLYRRDRRMLWWMIGLIVTSELILRFVFHYQRIHLMNYGWIFPIVIAIGICSITRRRIWLTVGITCVLIAHLLQMNRLEFARLYGRSTVPDHVAVAKVLNGLSVDSLVSVPTNFKGVEALSGRKMTIFREETLERLLQKGTLVDVFKHYGVTHILRYSDDLTGRVIRAMPEVSALEVLEGDRPKVTSMMNYLLHLFR